LDPTLIGSLLIDELVQTARSERPMAAKKSKRDVRLEIATEGGFLYQIARCFRKKVIRAWEKKNEKATVSLNSIKQSYETVTSLVSESDNDVELSSAASDAIALRVPFPVISGGIFNGRGELLLFGQATILTKENTPLNAESGYISGLPKSILDQGGPAKGTTGIRHHSFAPLKKYQEKAQNGKLNSNNSSSASIPPPADESKESRESDKRERKESEDYDLSFIKDAEADEEEEEEGEDENEKDDQSSNSNKSGRSSQQSQTGDVLGKLPSEIRRERKESNDFSIPNRRPSFHRDSLPRNPLSNTVEGADSSVRLTNRLNLVECGFRTMISLAQEYLFTPLRKNYSVGDGIKTKIKRCRENAAIAEKYFPKNRRLIQFWKLLSVALEVHSVEDIGSIINWAHSILGGSLFVTLVEYLITLMDTQTWATVICVLGDCTSILNLCLTSSVKKLPMLQKYFGVLNEKLNVYLELQLYIYSQWLHRWGFPLKATEVS
jgi:hypothetical protein